MPKLVVANWKLNPGTEREAVRLARATDARKAVLCPPFPFMGAVRRAVKHAALGGQDAFWKERGPFTGESSASMLRSLGARYVILGHSERRMHLGETDGMIAKKVRAALSAGLRVILCVGEPKEIRRKGLIAAKRFVADQLKKDLSGFYNLKPKTSHLVIAYEPIWAVGTGVPDRPEDSARMAAFIKSFLKSKTYYLEPKVLYGGSVNGRNAAGFFGQRDIDGALVGGASLKPNEFRRILAAARP